MSATSVLLVIIAVSTAVTGQVLLKYGMTGATARAQRTGASLVVTTVTSTWVLLGLAVFALSAVAWLATLSMVPLSIAYPFNALGYLALLAASTFILGERTNVWTWVGTALVATGLVIVVATGPSSEPAPSPAAPAEAGIR